eukprot:363588-Chlamydomonas_euryale.AAC.6
MEDRRSGSILVEGLSEASVDTAPEAMAVIERGERHRKVRCKSGGVTHEDAHGKKACHRARGHGRHRARRAAQNGALLCGEV